MKPRYITIAAGILAVAAVFFFWPEKESHAVQQVIISTATADGMKLVTNTDPTLVFQKAFWRRPSSDDKILHAERREWSSADGVQKWQWFISVRPGPQLLEWLKSNPFSLTSTESPPSPKQAPAWFPQKTGNFQTQQNTEGRFILMLSSDQKQLFATDSGEGFSEPSISP